jgi:alanyl-tRNA synthetase
MYTVNQIRSKFLEYFASQGHEVVKSSPLVPHNDPTLMFTNAGMVQFKDVFTQNETRFYTKAASSQKCVRAGGKHNDLDNVGYTARHHTFFEMLGNFSFGNYFKEDAIKYGWEFLTKIIGLPQDKLSVTVYYTDDEAYNLWKKIAALPDNKILRVPTSDNFWSMGDTGPCGPCSEIFYDHGDKIEGQWQLDDAGSDLFGERYIEIWNLVFMQYEKLPSGEQINLPAPSIDTGMGLERLAAVLQGKHNNYEIDLFENLIAAIKYETGNNDQSKIASHRVVADHLRSISFLLADGVMPSNEGRGYVLRRIMRRAMRHVRNLGCEKPVLYKIVPYLVKEMGGAYPELTRAQPLICEIIKLEEERFCDTLGRGLKLLEEEVIKLGTGNVFSGEVAFQLYDTYGFPYDLTSDILRGRQIEVDEAAYNLAMAEQKKRAKASWKGSGAKATDEVWFEIQEESGSTEFLGYETVKQQAKVIAIIKDGKKIDFAQEGDEISLILNQTPFYAESGGQEGDHGMIASDSGFKMQVADTQKMLGKLHVHIGNVSSKSIKVGDVVLASVSEDRRNKLRANHSATHILHSVLREILGDHVTQKGSLVAEDKLRFDISHPKAVTKEQLQEVEDKVNQIIKQNSDVSTRVMDPESAIEAGAIALFGEKYGDKVRVVNMGRVEDKDYSVELCGGVHVNNTADIKAFKIISESAIASGIRRIEAITADAVNSYNQQKNENYIKTIDSYKKEIANLTEDLIAFGVQVNNVIATTEEQYKEHIKHLKKTLAKIKQNAVMDDDIRSEDIKGIAFFGKNFGDISPKDLRTIITDLQKKIGESVIAVTSSAGGKASIIIAVSDKLTAKIDAVDLVKQVADILGAKGGGGKPNFAQTGGTNGDKVQEALDKIKAIIAANCG